MVRKYMFCGLLLFWGVFGWSQEESYDEFVRLYKANYLEWITSPEIAALQKENPDLAALIDQIPIQQTTLFQEELAKMKMGEKLEIDFEDFLNEDIVDSSIGLIKKLLAPENTEMITRLYWRVIESAETKEIADIIVQHMEKARDDINAASARAIQRQ